MNTDDLYYILALTTIIPTGTVIVAWILGSSSRPQCALLPRGLRMAEELIIGVLVIAIYLAAFIALLLTAVAFPWIAFAFVVLCELNKLEKRV